MTKLRNKLEYISSKETRNKRNKSFFLHTFFLIIISSLNNYNICYDNTMEYKAFFHKLKIRIK